MWHSNLEKFRRVLVFDAEKSLCFRKVFANWKVKKKCSVESARDTTSNFTKMYNLTEKDGVCKNDRAPIALSYFERFRFSDSPAHNLSEHISPLSIIQKGFKNSDPPSPQPIRAKQSSIYNSKCIQNF